MAALQQDLTQGSVAGRLVRYSVPLVCSSLLQSVYSIADIIIAGRFIGNAGISAINNASLIMNLLTQIAIGLTVGGNILIGQYFGSGDEENRKRASGTLFTLCGVVGVAGAAVFSASARALLVLLGAPALEEAAAYLGICAWGLFFIFGYNALSAILRAVGNSRTPLYFVLLSTALNVALDLLFVAGLGRGVEGAALATLIAQGAAFAAALGFVLRHRARLGFTAAYLRPTAQLAGKILRLGLPTALQWTIASVSWLAVAFLINRYGVDVSAGNGVSNKIKDFCQLFISAMTSGAATMIAQCLGAGRYDRAREVMRTCMKITLLLAACLILVSELFAPQLAAVFSAEPEVRRWAALNLRIEIVAQLFYAGFLTYNTLATGAGHTVFVMLNSFLNCIVVRLVLAVLFERIWGAPGVFLACALAPASSVPVGWWYCRSGRWRRSLAGDPDGGEAITLSGG